MFFGQFCHNLDDKGRLTVPARYRDLLVPDGAYVMQGFDRNLMVLPRLAFEFLSRQINSQSVTDPKARMLRRLLFATADRVEVDRAGRILIPQFLRDAAGLQNSVVVVGSGEYFELWSPEEWQIQAEKLQDVQANAEQFVDFKIASN
ncbi:MAG: division/cell wall cluster transcriptional repressor MraZ [Anaerolineales bacterium]|nr:division/cell wall cluster transcriptional repressor MraZ [Anaerolineales bacterium]